MQPVRYVTLAAAFALAVPTTTLAQPNRHQLNVKLRQGQSVSLTIGKVPAGEFAFTLRASSDDQKKVKVTQRRAGGTAFTVVNTASNKFRGACSGAAGTIICDDISTPVTPGNRSWTFTVTSTGKRPTTISLAITWRKVASAG